ncbi:MAG TPA: hypothetical protein EYP56_19940, partial [Planctomycetaceae bacterium]|nr:hypothetical protein [Planctomycetaceae bacterium]
MSRCPHCGLTGALEFVGLKMRSPTTGWARRGRTTPAVIASFGVGDLGGQVVALVVRATMMNRWGRVRFRVPGRATIPSGEAVMGVSTSRGSRQRGLPVGGFRRPSAVVPTCFQRLGCADRLAVTEVWSRVVVGCVLVGVVAITSLGAEEEEQPIARSSASTATHQAEKGIGPGLERAVPSGEERKRMSNDGVRGPGEERDKPGSEEAKPGEERAERPDEEEKEEKKQEGPKPIQRPSEPPEPPDPEQLKVRPDAEGKIRFNFVGQPWQPVLEWLADISGMSLDWQELPGDYLNLTTLNFYTLDEARDLINRHLLARGYTLLRHGEVLTVVKLDELNPAMVPRVEPDDLDRRDLHEFVKVSFPLDWLLAETAAEELKPMLSRYGKLNPLKATNRLEAIDAVCNLLEIRRVLQQEQSPQGQERLVRVFELRYARAEEVRQQLLSLLGIETKKPTTPTGPSPDQMRRMAEEMRRRAEEQAKRSGRPTTQPAKEQPRVNIVADTRHNTLIVHAPPDKMAIIEQAIRALDIPVGEGNTLLATMTRMQIYRLAAIDPEPLVKTLEEMGGLDPRTRLEVDKENRAVIAYATLADHAMIRQLIEKLDGSGRRFEVIPLRRLPADYVAGTIEFMMGGKEEETGQVRRYYYGPSPSQQSEKTRDEFRVDADVENNRLLLWANDVEIEEVMNLLVKLGEIPPEGGDRRKVRVLDATWDDDIEAWLERVRRAWPSVAPNPLVIPPGGLGSPEEEGRPESRRPEKTEPGEVESHEAAGERPAHRPLGSIPDGLVESHTTAAPLGLARTPSSGPAGPLR